MSERARERIRGVSAPLPSGERVRWQGAPDHHALARRVFHARKIAIYFGALIAWRAVAATSEPGGMDYFLAGAVPLAVLGGLGVACSLLLARVTARHTVYAVTDRRVVLRIGLALQSTINIPFRQIQGASVKAYPDGTGDIALRLDDEDRLAYLLLWPHARAWHFAHPQPTLRAVADVERLADMLRAAVLAVTEAGPAADLVPEDDQPERPRPAVLAAAGSAVA